MNFKAVLTRAVRAGGAGALKKMECDPGCFGLRRALVRTRESCG